MLNAGREVTLDSSKSFISRLKFILKLHSGAYARSGHLVCTMDALGCISATPLPPPSGTMAVCTIIAGWSSLWGCSSCDSPGVKLCTAEYNFLWIETLCQILQNNYRKKTWNFFSDRICICFSFFLVHL